MKKIALAAFGLLLTASPAFAEAIMDQYATHDEVGDTLGESYANSGNEGTGNTQIYNAGGIVSQNLNTGNASNTGNAVDVLVSGGVAINNGQINAGSAADTDRQLAYASLVQVSANNNLGNAVGTVSNSNSSNLGVSNTGLGNSQGIVSQNINTGNASNVGQVIGVTVK